MPADPLMTQVPAPPLPPAPPAPPLPGRAVAGQAASDAAARVDEALAQAREEVAEIAGQAAVGERGNVSILRDGQGRTIVNTADGRTIVIDPRAIPSPEAQQDLIDRAITTVPPPPVLIDEGPPQNAIILTAIVMFFLTLMVIGFPLVRAAVRRMDRKAAGGRVPDDLAPRLERMEQAIESVAVEMERVSEAQRFSARLLSERLPEALPRLDAAAAQGVPARRGEG